VDNAPEPIADDELLYRRVPLPWYSPNTGLMPEAFAPHKINDATGVSVARAKYKLAEDAARGRPGKQYYVACLQAGKLRENGIAVVPRPEPDDPGHSELPDLNAANRKDDRTLELQRLLVHLTIDVQGPFGPFSD
jgi:hypothetical protein